MSQWKFRVIARAGPGFKFAAATNASHGDHDESDFKLQESIRACASEPESLAGCQCHCHWLAVRPARPSRARPPAGGRGPGPPGVAAAFNLNFKLKLLQT